MPEIVSGESTTQFDPPMLGKERGLLFGIPLNKRSIFGCQYRIRNFGNRLKSEVSIENLASFGLNLDLPFPERSFAAVVLLA